MAHVVYGVSDGEYSDYHVVAIFNTHEKAVAYMENRFPKVKCYSCRGTGKTGPFNPWYTGENLVCRNCNGEGVYRDARVEEFDFNPTGEPDEE